MWGCGVLNFLGALLSRFLLGVHGVGTMWLVVMKQNDPGYWLLLMAVALMGLEMVITLKCTRRGEWKWFSPMVFLYLCTVIPYIWTLQLSLLDRIHSSHECTMDICINVNKDWVLGLVQTMLIALVLGRWLMPKGDMFRDQLSQLLMVEVGLGYDILDHFDTFDDLGVNRLVVIGGLAILSWALTQFPMVLTQAWPPKPGPQVPGQPPAGAALTGSAPGPPPPASCCSGEAWCLLLAVGLQDGPFLFFRLYLLIHLQLLKQRVIFFTCKNLLVVLLEMYRIAAVHSEQRRLAAAPGGGPGLESRGLALVLRHGSQQGSAREVKESSGGECRRKRRRRGGEERGGGAWSRQP